MLSRHLIGLLFIVRVSCSRDKNEIKILEPLPFRACLQGFAFKHYEFFLHCKIISLVQSMPNQLFAAEYSTFTDKSHALTHTQKVWYSNIRRIYFKRTRREKNKFFFFDALIEYTQSGYIVRYILRYRLHSIHFALPLTALSIIWMTWYMANRIYKRKYAFSYRKQSNMSEIYTVKLPANSHRIYVDRFNSQRGFFLTLFWSDTIRSLPTLQMLNRNNDQCEFNE